MFGVVLWSDNLDNKAVIWCEDHGDLAFFNGGTEIPFELPDLDPGDLVQFDLKQDRNLRYARNPRRVAQGQYEPLAEVLGGSTQIRVEPPIAPVRFAESDRKVVPFPKPPERVKHRRMIAG